MSEETTVTLDADLEKIFEQLDALSLGKAAQLVNWTKDDVCRNFFVVKTHEVTVTADVIEYTK